MLVLGIFLAFLSMEFVAWSAHKYLMHGALWHFHEDHHQPTGRVFQRNDLFFLIFAIPSWLCIMFGMMDRLPFILGIGIGIAVYGLVYFLVHDVLIHRRFKWFDNTQNRYFRGLRLAHKIHHKNRFKEGGECFGMLIVPFKYFQK